MCMITFIPAGVDLPYEGIENGAETNRDGHGWAVASRHGLQVGKSMDFAEALLDLDVARDDHGEGALALFHSRFATHGTVDEFNIHPFYIGKDESTVMAHNGILPSFWHPAKKDPRSDTRVLADRTLPHYLNAKGVPSRRSGKVLGQMIGSYNKLVILSVKSGAPAVRIVNAHMGEHKDGVWYSNTGYLPSYFSQWKKNYSSTVGADTGFAGYEDSVCEWCKSFGFINVDNGWCEACDTCNTCFFTSEHCECVWNQPTVGAGYLSDEELQARVNREFGPEMTEERLALPASASTIPDFSDLGAWATD
jgi:hypothetical protein